MVGLIAVGIGYALVPLPVFRPQPSLGWDETTYLSQSESAGSGLPLETPAGVG